MKEHRDDQLQIYSTGEDERQRLERMKFERADSDTQYFKQMMTRIEKRIDDEAGFRSKNEEDTRKYLETRLLGMQEKLKGEEKMALERERRMMS